MKNNILMRIIDLNNSDDTKKWNTFLYKSFNSNIYQSTQFLGINKYKCKELKMLSFEKNNKIIAILSLGIDNEYCAKSSFSASFSDVIYDSISIDDSIEIIKMIRKYCYDNDYKSIEICCVPKFYNMNLDERIEFAMLKEGFQLKNYELTLYKKKDDWYNNIKSSLVRNVRKAINLGLTFEKLEDIEFALDFLKIHKEKQGIKFNIEINDFKALKESFPEQINIFSVKKEEKILGIIILYEINRYSILGLNWTTDKSYNEYRCADFMLYKAIEWTFNNNYIFFDFGTITINSNLNVGVKQFKEKFNPLSALKKTYKLVIK